MLHQPNVRLTTGTYNFYLSLHTRKSSSPLLSLVCAVHLKILKDTWEDDPPQAHSPAGPVHLVFTGVLTNQDLGFLVFLSIITLLVRTRALTDVRCRFWSICRWSARMTPERPGVYLVVRECSELTRLWLNGLKNLGSSFYVCLIFLDVTVSCKGGETQPQNQIKRRPQTIWTCTEIHIQDHPEKGYIISCLCHCRLTNAK